MLILSYENEFNLHVKEISFSYERMSTKTRFEEEAKGNLEMAYSFYITESGGQHCNTFKIRSLYC